jgi:hypothetical protein
MFDRDWNQIKLEAPIGPSAIQEILWHCSEIVRSIPCKASLQFLSDNQEMLPLIYDYWGIDEEEEKISEFLHRESSTELYEFLSDDFTERIEQLYTFQSTESTEIIDQEEFEINHNAAYTVFLQSWQKEGNLEFVKRFVISSELAQEIEEKMWINRWSNRHENCVSDYEQYVINPSFDNIHGYEFTADPIVLFSIPHI